MKKLAALLAALILTGCSGGSSVGVYQFTWQGDYGENSITYDFRSDGTCIYTPYIRTYAGVMTQGDVDRTAVTVDNQPIHGTWKQDGGEIVVTFETGKHSNFKQEGKDLISSYQDRRYVKIH